MRAKLPQYEHKIVVSPNWERQLRMMRQGPLVCTSIMFYRPVAERASLKGAYLLSAPHGVFMLHDVVVKRENRHLFGEVVSFKELLRDHSLIFGYNRPYGIIYNRLLADYLGIPKGVELDAMDTLRRNKYLQSAPNISVRSGSDMIDGMIKMLLRGRVDYILEYVFMLSYYKKRMGISDELVTIPVTETQHHVSKIAYACSDTPAGQRAIDAINGVLKAHRPIDEYKQALKLLVPKGREKLYWQAYEEMLHITE